MLSVQPLFTSSVVVTFVQVIHRDTSCPANNENTKRLVQTLLQRAPKLEKNALGDDQSIAGRGGGEEASAEPLRDGSTFSSMLAASWSTGRTALVAISPAAVEVMVDVQVEVVQGRLAAPHYAFVLEYDHKVGRRAIDGRASKNCLPRRTE